MEVDFEKFSKQAVKPINQEINKLLKKWRDECSRINKNLLPLIDEFIKVNKGGKRLRGVLVVLGYMISSKFKVQSSKIEDIIKVAAAYEIIHTAFLVHDDVMDQSPLRRGRPALYVALGGKHYGISQAINLGDAGFFLATKAISEADFLDSVKLRAFKWFYQIMLDTTAGQMLDLDKGDPALVAKLKTARYTLVGPLVLGAILRGEEGKTLSFLEKFGENLGIAFQIKDDILDAETKFWGGVNNAQSKAEKYKNQALKILPNITKDGKMSNLLEQMAEYLINRKK